MKFYVVAGEASGDERGVELMRAIRQRVPDAEFIGAGGRKMRAFAGDAIFDWAERGVVGLVDVIRNFGYFARQYFRMLAEIEAAKPDALITIDYPGFNMRLAKAAKARMPGLRTIQYVSPQVWAWHRGRIRKFAKFLDLMLCLFPFEVPLYAGVGLKAVCVGHPLLDSLAAEKVEQARDSSLVALLPGSRHREIRKIFPIMVESAKAMKASRPSLRFEVAAANEALAAKMRGILAANGDEGLCEITLHTAHRLMQRATAGMVCSGTATLEATFFGLPMVLIYRVSWLTGQIARRLLRIPWLGLPNVLANREIIREFLQEKAQPAAIAAEVLRLIEDPSVRGGQQRAQADVIASLGEPGAARRAAEAILPK